MKMIIIRGEERAEYQESSGEFVGDAELVEDVRIRIIVTAEIGNDPYLQLSQNYLSLGADSVEYVPDVPDQRMMDA